MPNLDPATDTAEAAMYVAELGRRDGHCEVVPIGAVTKGRDGVELAELGLMSEVGVRVFSDDGRCVSDPVLMRRALEYVKAFDGVVAQHSQDPELTDGAQMNESPLSGELGLAGLADQLFVAEFQLGRQRIGRRELVPDVDKRRIGQGKYGSEEAQYKNNPQEPHAGQRQPVSLQTNPRGHARIPSSTGDRRQRSGYPPIRYRLQKEPP